MIQNQTFTTLGKKSKLEGRLELDGPTHLLGHFHGELHIGAGNKLILEIGSTTEGSLFCDQLEIYGDFTGQIKASGLVIIYPTANVNGKIIARSLEILPGAQVNMSGHTEDSVQS